MKLVEEFVLTASLGEAVSIGKGPIGHRIYFPVTEGTLVGERINARILSGGEWALLPGDGHVRVDVRFQAQTDDGAFLYAQYFGILERTEAVLDPDRTTATEFSDQHFYVNPRFETGDERYSWMNTTFFIGEGRMMPNEGVQYRVWRPK